MKENVDDVNEATTSASDSDHHETSTSVKVEDEVVESEGGKVDSDNEIEPVCDGNFYFPLNCHLKVNL